MLLGVVHLLADVRPAARRRSPPLGVHGDTADQPAVVVEVDEAVVGDLGDQDLRDSLHGGFELERTGQSPSDPVQQPVLFLNPAASQRLGDEEDHALHGTGGRPEGNRAGPQVHPGGVLAQHRKSAFPGVPTQDPAGELGELLVVGFVDTDVYEGGAEVVAPVIEPEKLGGVRVPVAEVAEAVRHHHGDLHLFQDFGS